MPTRNTYKTVGGKNIDVVSPDPTATGGDLLQDNAKAIADICESLAASISTAQSLLTTLQSSLTGHTTNTSNPHSVTKAQVGLGSVTNNAQLPLTGGTMDGDIAMADHSISGVDLLTAASINVHDIEATSGTLEVLSSIHFDMEGGGAITNVYSLDFATDGAIHNCSGFNLIYGAGLNAYQYNNGDGTNLFYFDSGINMQCDIQMLGHSLQANYGGVFDCSSSGSINAANGAGIDASGNVFGQTIHDLNGVDLAETRTVADTAQATADSAYGGATDAYNLATDAIGYAQTAQATADGAQSAANDAQSSAYQAQDDAGEALGVAYAAETEAYSSVQSFNEIFNNTYADNAAAVSDGKGVGTYYKTPTGEVRVVV